MLACIDGSTLQTLGLYEHYWEKVELAPGPKQPWI